MVYCRIIVSSLVQGIFLVNDPMFETVEQIVFFAACRIHFDRLMRFGRAAVVFDVGSFGGHTGIVSHDKDLHELTGFEAVGIAIAAAGVCFVQRVGRCRRCGIHHAKVWRRRQQHRKCKQHRQQLLFTCSSCFHVSSCFLLHIFLSQRKKRKSLLRFFHKKGCWDGRYPSIAGYQRFFPAAICHISFFLIQGNEKGSILRYCPLLYRMITSY